MLYANLIVLAFALIHAVICFFFRDTSFGDGFLLTCITILMVYSLIQFYNSPFDVFLGIAFLSCFAGFYLGTKGAEILHLWMPDGGVWVHVITTTAVTIILGEIIILLLRKNLNFKNQQK